MSTSAVSGSGSILDVRGIVDQLMQVEQRPLSIARQRVGAASVAISAMAEVKALVDTAAGSAKALEDSLMLSGRSVANSDASVVKASISSSSGAAPGSYTVTSTSFAKSQRTTFAGFASSSQALFTSGSGTLSITSSSADFGFDTSPASESITLDGKSLEAIRDEINANSVLSGKIVASIVNTGDTSSGSLGFVLVLSGSKTGSTASFSASWSDAGVAYDSGSLVSGLSSALIGPTQSGTPLDQASGDASATVNGITVRSKTNTFTEAVGGVSFDILQELGVSSKATFTVSDNRSTLKERISKFAESLSSLNKRLDALTQPGSDDKKPGPLSGNSGILSLRLALSSAYNAGFIITGTSGLNQRYTWSDVGLEVQRDGSVTVRSTSLDQAIDGVTSGYGSSRRIGDEMLGGFTSAAVSSQGFSGIRAALDRFKGSTGTVQGTIDILQSNKSRLSSSVSDLENKLERTRKTLIAKYAALDSKLAGMNQLSANVRSSLANLQQ